MSCPSWCCICHFKFLELSFHGMMLKSFTTAGHNGIANRSRSTILNWIELHVMMLNKKFQVPSSFCWQQKDVNSFTTKGHPESGLRSNRFTNLIKLCVLMLYIYFQVPRSFCSRHFTATVSTYYKLLNSQIKPVTFSTITLNMVISMLKWHTYSYTTLIFV